MTEWLADLLKKLPGTDALWVIIIMFITLDVILGTTNAAINGELSSAKARIGIMHKVGFLGAMLLCNIIDITQSIINLGMTVPTTTLCASMIALCEITSICEQVQKMNPNLNLKFLKIKKEDDNEGN